MEDVEQEEGELSRKVIMRDTTVRMQFKMNDILLTIIKKKSIIIIYHRF